MVSQISHWPPKSFLRFEESLDTSMGTARIVTDAGKAYAKVMGNPEGPHPLACELVAIQLAQWFNLPTFEYALLELHKGDIEFLDGSLSESGPAFVTRAVTKHQTWDGSAKPLEQLENQDDITRLVVFDTWIRNRDRHPPNSMGRRPNLDNVFLTGEHASLGRLRLIVMDHSHCFATQGQLKKDSFNVAEIRDPKLYGLFPAFISFVDEDSIYAATSRMSEITPRVVERFISKIPTAWEVSGALRTRWNDFICRRAQFVADTIHETIAKVCWPGQFWDTRSTIKKKKKRRME